MRSALRVVLHVLLRTELLRWECIPSLSCISQPLMVFLNCNLVSTLRVLEVQSLRKQLLKEKKNSCLKYWLLKLVYKVTDSTTMCYCNVFIFQSLCVCVCVYVCRLEGNLQEPVLPFHHLSLGIELGLTGLAANDFTQWTISLVQYWGMRNFIGSIIRISSCSERIWKMVQPGFSKGFDHQNLWEYKERLIISSKSPYGQVCKFGKT